MAASPTPGRPRRHDGTIVVLLSLKLLLLGFFIVLNANASYELNRAQAVIKSVNAAFNGRAQLPISNTANSKQEAERNQADALINEISALFDATFPAVKSEKVEHGAVLRLELSSSTLFRPGSLNTQPGAAAVIKEFATSLRQAANRGLTFTLEMLHGVPVDGTRAMVTAGIQSLELRRAGRMARVLKALGVPEESLSVGILPGRAQRVQFILRLFQQGQPMTNFLHSGTQGFDG